MARRARSAERPGAIGGDDLLDRLTGAIERLAGTARPAAPVRDPFKAPQFDGSGEVNYFIQQFTDVADANQWNPAATLLHLREALKDGARECGKANTIAGIFAALQARFGLSVREARAKLTSLRRDSRTSLQEHAAEVEKLVGIAYADLPERHRVQMALDTFCNTLGHAYLQRHLLAVHADTLEDAVRAGNEYLQIKPPSSSSIRQIEGEDIPGDAGRCREDHFQVNQAAGSGWEALMRTLQKLTAEVESLKAQQTQNKASVAPKSGEAPKHNRCWGCDQEGHFKRDCPRKASKDTKATSGNAEGPQQ